MALSQVQCLDDNHVNPRTHESKAEFLYCEEQRFAIETLLRDGREAFFKHLEARGLRGFLSDLELAALTETAEPYDPGAELYREEREDPEDEQSALSLHYWPDMSDMSTPELDIGWPDSEAYRGVTRTTVHTQPPLEGQVHIKEVIRKMIAQAQKVIAVVMDLFTDADIFRDLLDASYKRKVSVYILLERVHIPHFLSMCQRASMHTGHLKNIRVRCSEGTEFLTHSSTKIRGHMGHRFMFIDGDKAVSGSYSFTWMSSRLDRNLITVVTGQAVDMFDRLFRFLYTTSKLVDLRHVTTAPEPEPDPVPQFASVAPPSAAVARKLYNPKYALVAAGNASLSPSSSPGNNSPKESQKDTKNEDATKKGRKRQSKDAAREAPPLHPGLVDLEKAYLFDYLPIWPEPDPSSDVIGFINIRDTRKPAQVHLQRSEMFEVSQAIRFSSPFSKQKETLPEVAKPRNLTPAKHEEKTPQQKTLLELVSKDLTPSKSDKENAESPKKEPPTNKIHTSTAKLSPPVPRQSAKAVTNPLVSASSPKAEAKIDTPTAFFSESALENRNGTARNQPTQPLAPSDLKSQIKVPNLSQNTSSTGNIPSAVNSTSVSANYQVSPATAVPSTLTSASPIQPSNAISTSVSKPTNPPIATPPVTSPPVPKPRTVQLVIKDSPSNGQTIPEVSIVKRKDSKAKVTAMDNEPLVVTALPQKESETVPELANKSAGKSIPQKSAENTAARDCSQQKESKESLEVQAGDKGELQPVAGNKIITPTNARVTEAPREARVNIHKEVPEKEEPSNAPRSIIIKTRDVLNEPTEVPLKNSAVDKVQSSIKIGRLHQARASLPPRITSASSDENLNSLNSPIERSPILKPKQSSESTPTISLERQQGDTFPHASEDMSRTAKLNSHAPLLSPRAPTEKPTYLHLKNSQMVDSTTPERDSRTLLTQRHSPILDGFLPRVPTPESRRSRTPDFRTPTSDISDGYGSTTSDEYYECSDSPFHESKDQVPFHSLNATEDREIHIANSFGSFKEQTAALSIERTLSSCETLNSSTKGSLSSILEKLDHEEKLTNENRPKGIERPDGNLGSQAIRDNNQSASKSSKAVNQPAVAEQSLTLRLNNETTEAKRTPARELKPKRVHSRAERPDRMPAGGEKTALGGGGVERRDNVPAANKEPEGHKFLMQQPALGDFGAFAQLRLANPSRPPRSLSATQSTLLHLQGHRAERKLSEGDLPVSDGRNPSPSDQLPPRPPAPKAFPNQHYWQLPPSPTKPKAGQTPSPSPLPKPQPSFLFTHSQNTQQAAVSPPPAGEGLEEEKIAFGITLSKLYNLKGLKDKMGKMPAQNRRSSGGGGAAQKRKSTG